MDDTIMIRPSTTGYSIGPHELRAPRAVLIAGSKVFADMLSLPHGPPKKPVDTNIDVAEPFDELKPFLRVLNMSHDKGDPLKELEPKDWAVVARLADKYDSATARGFALGMCWKWKAQDTADENLAGFNTAANIHHADLSTLFLIRLLRQGRPLALASALHDREAQFIITPPSVTNCVDCAGEHGAHIAELTLYRALHQAMRDWASENAADPFVATPDDASSEAGLCDVCDASFNERVAQFEERYRETAPKFPA